MFQLFYRYLILNKKATLPGLGIFYIDRRPAKLDFANKVFIAPATHINFKSQTSQGQDDEIFVFIAKEEKVDASEAATRFGNFADKLKKNLKEEKSLELPGLGVLTQNAAGELSFKETVGMQDYFPAAAAERVLRENTEHHVLVGETNRTNTEMKEMLFDDAGETSHTKDYWWISAIVLGIIGIATIVYYYLHNGKLH